MCGAYGFSVNDAKEVYDRFEVENSLEDLKARWNVRPGQMNRARSQGNTPWQTQVMALGVSRIFL